MCCSLYCSLYCSLLQCFAVCCSVNFLSFEKVSEVNLLLNLQCVYSVCCNVCGSVLQCVAVRCSALQCVAVCCSVMQCAFPFIWKVSNVNSLLDSQCKSNVYRSLLTKSTAMCCDTIHHTATHCNTLQHTATHRNTL